MMTIRYDDMNGPKAWVVFCFDDSGNLMEHEGGGGEDLAMEFHITQRQDIIDFATKLCDKKIPYRVEFNPEYSK